MEVVEHGGGERTAIDRAGVDVQPVGSNVGAPVRQGRMSMNNEKLEQGGGGEERLSHPEEVIIVLVMKRAVGIDARVDIDPMLVSI